MFVASATTHACLCRCFNGKQCSMRVQQVRRYEVSGKVRKLSMEMMSIVLDDEQVCRGSSR